MRSIAPKTLLLMAVVSMLAACVTVESARLGTGVIRPPVPADQVAIFRTASQVGARYDEVALLDAAGDYAYTNEEQMFAKLRQKAGALGANGVILEGMSEPTTGAKVARFLIGTPAERRGHAIAIFVEGRAVAQVAQ